MKTWERGLAILVAFELLGAGLLAVRTLARPRPPLPDFAGRDPLAAAELRELRERAGPGDAKDWEGLAGVYLAYGFFPEADACYRRLADLAPRSYTAAYGHGQCLDKLGRMAEALEAYRTAAAWAPQAMDRSSCWYHVGRDYLRLEQAAEAEAAFVQAGAFPHARYELAKLCVRSGRAAEALPILQEALEAFPRAMEFKQLQARALAALGRGREAARYRDLGQEAVESVLLDHDALRLTSLRVRYGSERKNQAIHALEREGAWARAAEALRALLGDTWNAKLAVRLLGGELQLGHAEEVLRLFDDYQSRAGVSPVLLAMAGEACSRLGREEQARAYWERGLRMRETERLHANLQRYHEKHGRQDLALHHRALALQARGVEALHQDDLFGARNVFDEALALAPGQASLWFFLGETCRRQSDLARAAEAYGRCAALDPGHACGRAQARLAEVSSSK